MGEYSKKINDNNNSLEVPIWHKELLTIDEAALYTNIGQNRIAKLLNNPLCPFVLYVGRKRLIKRIKFEKYLDEAIEID